MTTENKMWIWNAVCVTDPGYTKKVQQRGGFTSIDAMYQIKRATELLGPVGQCWWYECLHSIQKIEGQVAAICDVMVYWKDGSDTINKFGPVRGINWIYEITKNGPRYDDDAPKKAMTDALTKALSHLGFSADVFLGWFDDNKYVQKITAQFSGRSDGPEIADHGGMIGTLKERIASVENLEGLNSLFRANRAFLDEIAPSEKEELLLLFGEKKRSITGGS